MSSFIALRKTLDLSSDANRHILVGRQNRDIPSPPSPTPDIPYDAEVEWLYAPNGAYIDTSIQYHCHKVQMKFKLDSSSDSDIFLFGLKSYSYTYTHVTPWSNRYSIGGLGFVADHQGPELDDEVHEFSYDPSSGYWSLDGTNYTALPAYSAYQSFTGSNIMIGYRGGSASGFRRAYWIKIYDCETGALVRDLIPVRVGQNGCMYDRVSETLFENAGSGSFTYGPDVNVVVQNSSSSQEEYTVVTTLKKHYDFTVTVSFDSNGGTSYESQTYTLGSTYKDLPEPTKTQNVFLGWLAPNGQYVTSSSKVELSNVQLIAQWEYVNITGDYTSYLAVVNSSYRNTGIYSATRYSSASAVYVDWGDGAVERVDDNISKLAHTYSTDGSYIVKVSNNITNFAPSYNDSDWFNTTSQNRYTFKSMVTTGSRMTATNAMPSQAFYYCTALSSIDWLSSCYTGLTAIPSYAFHYCQGIKSLSSLPTRIKDLGNNAFYYCTGLTGTQDLRNTGLTSLYSSHIFYYCTNVKEWKLPSTLTGAYFGSYVFGNNSTLSAIQLPESLTAIASYCFSNDTQLKSINIPAKTIVVNSYAFNNCQQLSAIDWQTTALTSVQNNAFQNCYELRDLSLPGTVRYIGNYAFQNCRAFQASALALPSSLTSLGSYAYQGCYRLKQLEIPSALTVINDYAFAGCYGLSSIVDYRLTAQNVYSSTFGNNASNNASNGYAGYNSRGNNILCTYVAANGFDDGYWSDPLQNSAKCGFNLQYIDPENLKYCNVVFDAEDGDVTPTSADFIQRKTYKLLPTPTCPVETPYFGGWYIISGDQSILVTSKDIVPEVSSLTLHAYYSEQPVCSYEVDLNGQWRTSTSQSNPDSSAYDGVYESNSNYNVGNGYAKMYVRISGYDEFTIYIRSYGESSYDYTLAFNEDVDVTSNPSTSTSGVKVHTSGNQQSGQAIGNYTKVTYTNLAGGSHFICVVYRKDGSVNSGNDRGYVLIPSSQQGSGGTPERIDWRSPLATDDKQDLVYGEDGESQIALEKHLS